MVLAYFLVIFIEAQLLYNIIKILTKLHKLFISFENVFVDLLYISLVASPLASFLEVLEENFIFGGVGGVPHPKKLA